MDNLRVVYGATCLWWDTIDKIDKLPSGLPCCPHCHGVLFEMPNEKEWWRQVNEHEKKDNPNYREFIKWLRGKCYFKLETAQHAWKAEMTND